AAPEPLDLAALIPLWDGVVETVRAEHGLLAAHLANARPVRMADGALVLAFAEAHDFSRRQAEEVANRAILAHAVHKVTGRVVKLVYELHDGDAVDRSLSEDELVEQVVAKFDAEELPPDEQEAT
ncbi:MAG: hypothetical protein M3155_08160, partial [Actinomycetota bacterium]|nr:hypothetical protein [Actinomycetota bacterium]